MSFLSVGLSAVSLLTAAGPDAMAAGSLAMAPAFLSTVTAFLLTAVCMCLIISMVSFVLGSGFPPVIAMRPDGAVGCMTVLLPVTMSFRWLKDVNERKAGTVVAFKV